MTAQGEAMSATPRDRLVEWSGYFQTMARDWPEAAQVAEDLRSAASLFEEMREALRDLELSAKILSDGAEIDVVEMEDLDALRMSADRARTVLAKVEAGEAPSTTGGTE